MDITTAAASRPNEPYDADSPAELIGLALLEAGFVVFPADSELRPTLTAAHPIKGLLAVDVVADVPDSIAELNRRVAQLRADVPDLEGARISRRVVEMGSQASDGRTLSLEAARSRDWIEELPDRPLDPELLDRLGSLIAPSLVFHLPRRGPLEDDQAAARAAKRVVLDFVQAAVAMRPVDDVMVVTGPPGCGKTLVLAARAKWLAELHPTWKIQMLCYNRLLVPYLRSLVKGHRNISVDTFGKFTHSNGLRVSLGDEASSAADVERALSKAFPVVDAFLVDEWQDFFPSWTALLAAMLLPGRGGMVLAGDPKQALYRDGDLDVGLQGRHVIHEKLSTPYRSTRQILEVTSYLDPALAVTGRDGALEGEPVDLVSAENHREQAAAVARDIRWLLDDGIRRPENIGVLYTRRFQLGAIAHALQEQGVPYEVGNARVGAQFSLATPRVKVITVHSAKGYEFDVVFLVGLEQLPDPDGTPEGQRQGRTGYVGATRARDQLVITYSKPNAYLDRLKSAPEEVLRRWIWPEDYSEVK